MNKIATQLKSRFSRRGQNFSDELLSVLLDRVILETPSLDAEALARGEPSAQNDLIAAISSPPEVAFSRTVEVTQGVAATGAVVLNGVPVDGNTVTIEDGNNPAVVFEFDEGTKASGTLGLTAQPADTNTFTLGDGVITPIFEFDSGTVGVASSGAVLTFNSVPVNGEILTLKKSDGTTVIFQFKTSGLADEGKKMVYIGTATTAAKAAKEFIASVNGTGSYYGNYSTGFVAVSGGSGIVNLTRSATGASNETITSGTAQVETATAAGSITTTGNASVTVTGVGITGTPLTTAVAVSAGTKQKETATAVGTVTVGVLQKETATVVGTVTGSGNATVVVTAAGMTNSPKTVSVAVLNLDTASDVGGKIRTALGLDADVSAFFTVGGSTDTASLTALTAAANDATMNISIANGTCTGLTSAPTSANTTAGVAPGTGNATVVVTAVGMTNSPKTLSVAVVAGDNASAVGGKIRTALGLDVDVSAFFNITGATSAAIVEAKVAAANDATMNVSIANGTCTGLTTAATSSNTTAGVAFDTAAAWALKVRTALGGVAAITNLYTVGGSSTSITLTRVTHAANDSTLNIALADGTCVGITAAPTSVDTTAGNSGTAVTVTSSFSGGVTAVTPGTGITGGHVGVAIGATVGATRTNLIAAINAQTSLLMTAVAGTGNNTTVRAKSPGTAGNSFTTAKSGANLTVTGATLSGGVAAGSGAVGGGHTAVAIAATAALSAAALHAAINSATLDITSTNSPATHCALANTKTNGAAGNIAILKAGTNITVTGMSGGADSSTEVISDDEVGAGRKVYVNSFVGSVASSWSDAASVVVAGNDDTAFATILQSALVNTAPIFPTTVGVTLEDATLLGTGGTDGSGLKVGASDVNEETGGTLTITVNGVIKTA